MANKLTNDESGSAHDESGSAPLRVPDLAALLFGKPNLLQWNARTCCHDSLFNNSWSPDLLMPNKPSGVFPMSSSSQPAMSANFVDIVTIVFPEPNTTHAQSSKKSIAPSPPTEHPWVLQINSSHAYATTEKVIFFKAGITQSGRKIQML